MGFWVLGEDFLKFGVVVFLNLEYLKKLLYFFSYLFRVFCRFELEICCWIFIINGIISWYFFRGIIWFSWVKILLIFLIVLFVILGWYDKYIFFNFLKDWFCKYFFKLLIVLFFLFLEFDKFVCFCLLVLNLLKVLGLIFWILFSKLFIFLCLLI